MGAHGASGNRGREAAAQPSRHFLPSLRKRRDRDGEMLPRGRKKVWVAGIEESTGNLHALVLYGV